MFVHIFSIPCHQRLGSFPAKDNTCQQEFLAVVTVLDEDAYNISFVDVVELLHLPQLWQSCTRPIVWTVSIYCYGRMAAARRKYIYAARCHPATSVFRQGILNRVYQRGRRKSTYWVRLYVKLSHTVALVHLQRGIIQGLPSHRVS
jgi:hypothetical protein